MQFSSLASSGWDRNPNEPQHMTMPEPHGINCPIFWLGISELNSMWDMASDNFKSSKCSVSAWPVEASVLESYMLASDCGCCKANWCVLEVELCGRGIGPIPVASDCHVFWNVLPCGSEQGGNLQSSTLQSLSGYAIKSVHTWLFPIPSPVQCVARQVNSVTCNDLHDSKATISCIGKNRCLAGK